MRIITHISIALLLLITSTGFTLSAHFCHNKLVEVSIDKQVEPCCENCNSCRTETLLVHLNDEVLTKAAVSVPSDFFNLIFIPTLIHLLASSPVETKTVELVAFISPPPPNMQTVLSSLQTYLL